MFPFVSFLRTLLLQLLHLEPTNGRVNICGTWFASVTNFKDDVIPSPKLTRLVVMNLLRTSLSRYLSRALSPRSLYFSVFFCLSKQTDTSVLMMSCFRPQASMADAWHSHAIHHCPLYTAQTTKSFSSTCMLQTNSCGLFNMRVCALLFFFGQLRRDSRMLHWIGDMKREKRGKRYRAHVRHVQWRRLSLEASLLPARLGELTLRATLLTRLWVSNRTGRSYQD